MSARGVREFDGVRVDTGYWPIVLVEFPERRVPDEAVHAALDALEAMMKEARRSKEKIYVVTDLTRMRQITPASQRKYTAEWAKRTDELARSTTIGGAYVTPSAILRGIITAVFWLYPRPRSGPTVFVATRDEAMASGIDELTAAKALLSPQLIEYREAARRDPSVRR
jgi:hypothetical protein